MRFTDPLAETTLKLIEDGPRHIRELARDGYDSDACMVLDAIVRQARLLAQVMRNQNEKAKRP